MTSLGRDYAFVREQEAHDGRRSFGVDSSAARATIGRSASVSCLRPWTSACPRASAYRRLIARCGPSIIGVEKLYVSSSPEPSRQTLIVPRNRASTFANQRSSIITAPGRRHGSSDASDAALSEPEVVKEVGDRLLAMLDPFPVGTPAGDVRGPDQRRSARPFGISMNRKRLAELPHRLPDAVRDRGRAADPGE